MSDLRIDDRVFIKTSSISETAKKLIGNEGKVLNVHREKVSVLVKSSLAPVPLVGMFKETDLKKV